VDTISEFMKRDHARLDRLFRDYRGFKRSDRRKAASRFSEFRGGLLRHIGWEEEVLFPLVQRGAAPSAGPTAVMRLEHQQIKELLQDLEARLGARDDGAEEPEARLVELLDSHNRKEEVVLYPWLDGLLSEAQRRDALVRIRGSAECL